PQAVRIVRWGSGVPPRTMNALGTTDPGDSTPRNSSVCPGRDTRPPPPQRPAQQRPTQPPTSTASPHAAPSPAATPAPAPPTPHPTQSSAPRPPAPPRTPA